jgi:hypothetical protein
MYVYMYVRMYVPMSMFRRILTIIGIKNLFLVLQTKCVFCVTAHKFLIVLPRTKSMAKAQTVSRRPLDAEARDRSQTTPCKDCGGQGGTETGFPPRTSVVLCQHYFTSAPYWSSSASCSYRKDKRAKPTNLPKKQCSLGNRRDGRQSSFTSLSSVFSG